MDIEKTMQFILETQAKHEIAIQQADERFLRFREQTEERFRSLVDVTMSLARLGEETDRRIHNLTESQAQTDRTIRELRESQAHNDRRIDAAIDITQDTSRSLKELGKDTDRRIKELVGSGQETDRRLNALASAVDKLVKRNGRGQ